jgi:hypothetical protein
MSNLMVENQTEQVSIFLEDAINLITNYVNYHTLPLHPVLLRKKREVVSLMLITLYNIAHSLLVFPLIKRKTAAEKILYKIYHQVIAEFFSPKSDHWYENSRFAKNEKSSH